MKKEQMQKRLEVTEEQLGLVEKCLVEARADKDGVDPRIYRARIAQYNSVRHDLLAEAEKYRSELGLDTRL